MMRRLLSFLFVLAVSSWTWNNAAKEDTMYSQEEARRHECNETERIDHAAHCSLMDKAISDPEALAGELNSFAWMHGLLLSPPTKEDNKRLGGNIIGGTDDETKMSRRRDLESALPVVLAHGMGDSCFNSGFQSVVKRVSDMTGAYATCIPTGNNRHEDTIHGYLLNMDASVEIFAQKIKSDPNLSDGFHVIGFSQGSNIVRGYITKHNDPIVHTFISINGVNAGTGAVPYCLDVKSLLCRSLLETASKKAYTPFSQLHSFQANYWRDPSKFQDYVTYSQLARWNNEVSPPHNMLYNQNYANTKKFVWIMAQRDEFVWPKEGEQWGAPDPQNPWKYPIVPRNETDWFVHDLFGLRTAEEAHKNYYEQFDGKHLAFDWKNDCERWITTYLIG